MSEILRPFQSPMDAVPSRPYLHFFPAKQSGRVVLEALNIRNLDEPLGVVLGHGRKPQQNDAGVIAIGEDKIIAVDHVQLLHADHQQALIGPASKDAVDKDSGAFQGEGVLSVSYEDGRVDYVGGVIDTGRKPWLANRLGVAWRNIGGLAVVQFGVDAPEHETVDVDPETGIVVTKPRGRYW